MKELFGLPVDHLLVALTIIFVLGLVCLTCLALRHRVFFKMAVRNVPRRRTQTVLILLGLMLATLLFSASFTTGETLTRSVRVMALKGLGEIDELVAIVQPTQNMQMMQQMMGGAQVGQEAYIDRELTLEIRHTLRSNKHVAGVAPMLRLTASMLNPGTKLSEPQVTVLGLDPSQMAGFDKLLDTRGKYLSLAALGPDQVYISSELAEKTDTENGGKIQVYLGRNPIAFRVAGIYKRGANPATVLSMAIPLARLQELAALPGKISGVMITNAGDALAGAAYSDEVAAALKPLLVAKRLQISKVKQETLATADKSGAMFTSMFLILGQFSIVAGVLLIFLIYVMLAAERQHELGITRAVGGQRGHIVQMFAFEGAIYALLAAAIGSLLGVAVGWGMVRLMTLAFSETPMQLEFACSWKNVFLAYTLGVVLTFGVALLASWRVSRLNIVRAIRDLPEPRPSHKNRTGLAIALVLCLLGVVMTAISIRNRNIILFMLGVSFCIIGLPLMLRRYGLKDRAVFTLAGLGLLIWWLLPDNPVLHLLPRMDQRMETFFVTGLMINIGAIWTVMYNADLLLGVVVRLFGRVRGLPPVLRYAVSHPLQNRFRTGMTLAMFGLIVFTLVAMSIVISSQTSVFKDTARLTGGFDIRASAGNILNPVTDLRTLIQQKDRKLAGDIAIIAGSSTMPVRLRQAGMGAKMSGLFLTGVDEEYPRNITYKFVMKAKGYRNDRAVWRALSDEPDTVVVSAMMVPARLTSSFGGMSEGILQFKGFWREDKVLPRTYLEVANPITGAIHKLKVIGVLEQAAVTTGSLAISSRRTLNGLFMGREIPPQTFLVKTKPGIDPSQAARRLEAGFLDYGMQAEVMGEEIVSMSDTMIVVVDLLTGFMGLGLIVGIAALGVIAARAVVERWREIGVLRAIGFQRRMVQFSFLLESSFVALLGILIGVALGIALAPQIINLSKQEFEGMILRIPVLRIVLIIIVAYVASLLTTYMPARKAAKIYPAEALRYE